MVDDGYTYAAGLRNLPEVIDVLLEGTMVTGVGLALGDDHSKERAPTKKGEPP